MQTEQTIQAQERREIQAETATETRHPKIVSFFINDITGHGYSMQLTTEIMKPIKKLLKT